ncbi:MAG TPA: M15 family metallopeptidase [Melioribacteraceae bacterium]|nr:M15 family metallopeptidase [Melioribacteraceae bacterium]
MIKKMFLLFFAVSIVLHAQGALDEMVNPKELIPDIVIDLRYSSADHQFRNLPNGNILLPKMYTANECLMLLKAVNMLKIAQDSLRNIRVHNGVSYPQGIGIKIWDGYRPRAVQYLLFAVFPNPVYVADPTSGSKHNRGGAIDLTLIDLATGQELEMPTLFDDFSDKAAQTYNYLTPTVLANRQLLRSVMSQVAGFSLYDSEWWHYEIPGASGYPLLDFQMK